MSDGSQRPTFGRRSVRTPLGAGLRRMFAVHESAAARGLPVEAVLQELEQKLEAATARLIDEGLRELGEAGRAHYETAQSRT